MQPGGWLYGTVLRSEWPAARIRAIDLQPALRISGIKAAVVANSPPFIVRYYGQEIAAVAGGSKQACLDALRAIQVDAEPLPFVVKEEAALADNSPRVFENQPNAGDPRVLQVGDPKAAFQSADKIVEGFFQTAVQLHHALETHGNTIQLNDDGLTCWASTQGISSVKDGLADNLSVPLDRVHVISDFMGGGFGAKNGPGVEGGLAARLSKEAGGQAVRLMLTRFRRGVSGRE